MTDKHCIAMMAATIHAGRMTHARMGSFHCHKLGSECTCAEIARELFRQVDAQDTKDQFTRRD